MRVEETMADLLQATSVSRTCFSDRRDHIQTSYLAPEGNRVSLTSNRRFLAHSRVSHSAELIVGVSLKELLFVCAVRSNFVIPDNRDCEFRTSDHTVYA